MTQVSPIQLMIVAALLFSQYSAQFWDCLHQRGNEDVNPDVFAQKFVSSFQEEHLRISFASRKKCDLCTCTGTVMAKLNGL